MRNAILLICLFLASCTHTVYKMDVEQKKKNRIAQETTKACGGSCEIDDCWYEKRDFIVCNVKFSFVSDLSKGEMLVDASDRLSIDQLNVGFCARDTVSTSLTFAFIGGMVFGALGGAPGAPGSGAFSGSDGNVRSAENQKLIDVACSSEPAI